jgi:hypothetical protein
MSNQDIKVIGNIISCLEKKKKKIRKQQAKKIVAEN